MVGAAAKGKTAATVFQMIESDEKNEGRRENECGERNAQKRLTGSGRRYPKEKLSRQLQQQLCDPWVV
jgi:hypothetical protein